MLRQKRTSRRQNGKSFAMQTPETEGRPALTPNRTGSTIILEKIYSEVLEGKTLSELHGGVLTRVTPAVRTAVRDYLLFRTSIEPPLGAYTLNLLQLGHNLGFESDSHRRVQLMRMRRMPVQFQEALFDVCRLEEIGEALGKGTLPQILAEKEHWNSKHWGMISVLAVAAYEGSFEKSEINPLHYLMKRHGRNILRGIISPEHIRMFAHELGVGLRKPSIRMTPEQREFIKAFAVEANDAEIARALRLPEHTVAYFRARLRIRKKEAVETEQEAAQVKEIIVRKIRELVDGNDRISDREVASRLQSMGFPVARRTVNKYRKELGETDNLC